MKKTLRKYWRNEFIQGGFIFTLSSFIASVINYLFNLLAARGLGPSGFGEITALFSYMAIFSVPTTVMTLVVIQKVGSKGKNSERFALSLEDWFFRLVKRWWFLLIPLFSTAFFIPRITNLSPLSGYVFVPLLLLTFLGAFYGAIFQGLKFFYWFAIISNVAVLLKLLGSVFVILGVDGLGTIMTFLILSGVIGLLAYRVIMKKYIVVRRISRVKTIQKRLTDALFNKQVIITFLSIFALTSLNNIDIIFVKKFFSPTNTGIYSSWSLFAKIIFYLVGPAVTVSYIFFSHKKNEGSSKRVLYISIGTLVFIGLCSFISYRYFPSFLIRFLFGDRFLSVAPYLAQASIFGTLYTMIAFLNNYFLAKESIFSLLLPVAIPIYTVLLFLMPRTLSSVIALNIYFSLFLTSLYLIASSWKFLYNRLRWKRSSLNTS